MPGSACGVAMMRRMPFSPACVQHLLRLFPCLRAVIQPVNQMMMDIDKPVRWTFFQSLSFFFP